jgi:sigma-B regulation protein RsbU (phosphoserine phosphatase)
MWGESILDTLRRVSSVDAADREQRLEYLGSLTEAELADLDPEEFLAELLRRLCGILKVDIAVILLLDQHAQQLVTTAAVGLEEEVRQRFRLAVGDGFAGRVAARQIPITTERVHLDDVQSPFLKAKNVRSLAGVPIMAGGTLIGVLKIATTEPRTFTSDDVRLLEAGAERAAIASQQRVNHLDRQAALALQRGLLPTRLPVVPGMEFAARYVPGQDVGVGGDWYDVFRLPDDWLGIVVGDVSGHGLAAAVVMGRLRSALRAYALDCADPAEVLGRLDRKIHHFETGNLATALYAMISPNRNSILISIAGHPPPILAAPGEPTHLLDLPADLPLGIGDRGQARRSTEFDLPPGGLIVCYTDGLVERRRQPITEGLARLRAAVLPQPAEEVCQKIMATMHTTHASDDIAIVTARRTSANN